MYFYEIYYWGGYRLKLIEKTQLFNLFKNMVKICEGNLESVATIPIEIILFGL